MVGGQVRGAAVLCASQFVDVLGVTVVITALPVMLADLGAPTSVGALVLTGYALFFGSLLMLGARLGDRYGHARALQWALLLFAVASVVAAVATHVVVLVLARCALGAAAAVSVPAALRMLSQVCPDETARRRALAAWSAAGAAAGASGFLLGGLLTDLAGWRSLFWINVPMTVALLVGVRRLRQLSPPPTRVALDLRGALLLTSGIASLVVGASLLEQPDGRTTAALVLLLGAGLLAAFAHAQRRATAPLLPPAALGDRRLRTGAAIAFANTASTSSVTIASLYLQQERGLGAAATGAALLPFSLCVVAGSTLAAPLQHRIGLPRTAAAGLLVIATGNAALLAIDLSAWAASVAVAVAGLGIGLSSVASTTLGTSVAPDSQGTAAGAVNTAAQLGTALGTATLVLVASTSPDLSVLTTGEHLAWALACLTAAATAAWLLTSASRRAAPPTAPTKRSG